jgi:hypothetical protein
MLRWTAAAIAALLTLIIACGSPPLPPPLHAGRLEHADPAPELPL